MNKILIIDATGSLGLKVINQFLAKKTDDQVIAFVQDGLNYDSFLKRGVEIRTGDYADYDSLLAAFKGITRLFIAPADNLRNFINYENVFLAAKKMGIKNIICTQLHISNDHHSSPVADINRNQNNINHWLKRLAVDHIILKHSVFAEMMNDLLETAIETGVLAVPAGSGKIVFSFQNDIAAIVADMLSSPIYKSRFFNLSGPRSYSLVDIANIIAAFANKAVEYTAVSREEYIKSLFDSGLSVRESEACADFFDAVEKGEFAETAGEIEPLLGRGCISITEFLAKLIFKKLDSLVLSN